MDHEIFEKTYVKLTAELDKLGSRGNVKNLAASLLIARNSINEIRELALAAPFDSPSDEIHFFKHIKPKFYAQKILSFELYSLEMNRPLGTVEMVLSFLKDELRQVHRFFKQHAFLYQYYRSGAVELDYLYFVRGAEMPTLIVPEMPDPDQKFSTAMDYLFAKFIAYELLQQEILKRIGMPDNGLAAGKIAVEKGLKWTGSIVNLAELIYGLHDTGQLNNGNAQIADIVELFERMFRVKIRDVHHTFGEIKERKVSSPSKFLDAMGLAIKNRVEEDMRYKGR